MSLVCWVTVNVVKKEKGYMCLVSNRAMEHTHIQVGNIKGLLSSSNTHSLSSLPLVRLTQDQNLTCKIFMMKVL